MSSNDKILLLGMWGLSALTSLAWDVEHDVVVQLVGESLPREIRQSMTFDDFDTLLACCHYPDEIEWTMPDGMRRYRTLAELNKWIGTADVEVLRMQGFNNAGWFHSVRGRGVCLSLMAKAFQSGNSQNAAFYISVLSHSISDQSALNHPPLLHFLQCSNLPGVDYSIRKVEPGAKNVFGFRSDGRVVHRVRELLKGWRPETPSGNFTAVCERLVARGVEEGYYAGVKEGVIAFEPVAEAEQALAELVAKQVRTIVDFVWTAWVFRTAWSLPDANFDQRLAGKMEEMSDAFDPSVQSVFKGVFDLAKNPAQPKATVGVVCEPYGLCTITRLSYVGRMLTAAAARTLRDQGYAVRPFALKDVAKGFPSPAEMQVLFVDLGGCRLTGGQEAAIRAYVKSGGHLIAVGGEDTVDVSGFRPYLRHRRNDEVPVSRQWGACDADAVGKMTVIRDGVRTSLRRNPNINGFCKPYAMNSIVDDPSVMPLVHLDNGHETFAVAAQRGKVTWISEYLLMPFVWSEDTSLDWCEMRLDSFASKLLLDVVRSAVSCAVRNRVVGNCTLRGAVSFREMMRTDPYAVIDEMERFGVNVIYRFPSYGTGGLDVGKTRDILAYARKKGVRAFIVPTTAVYDRATHPADVSLTNWPCCSLHRPWQDSYYCWAEDDLIERAAGRCADILSKIGAEDAIVMLHPLDGGGLEDPENWSKRCAKCRARWKDEERWRAAANICNIWSRVLRRRCPKAILGSCIYHYALSHLDRPKAERDDLWWRNFHEFWRRMDESVEDPRFAFDSWIYRAGLSNEVRRLVKSRPILQMDTFPTYAGVFSSSARHAGAGVDPVEPSAFIPFGMGVPFSWETVFFTAACLADPSLPGCEPYSGHTYYNPFKDHTGPRASVEGVMRPICRRFWGEALAPDMEKFLLSGVLPLYIDDPAKTVSRWNKIVKDPTFDEVTGVSVGGGGDKRRSPIRDSPEMMRAQVAKAAVALAAIRRVAANPAVKALGPVQRDTLDFRLKAAAYWLASARTQANRREIAVLEKSGKKADAAKRRVVADVEFSRDFAEAERGGEYKGWRTNRAFFERLGQ